MTGGVVSRAAEPRDFLEQPGLTAASVVINATAIARLRRSRDVERKQNWGPMQAMITRARHVGD